MQSDETRGIKKSVATSKSTESWKDTKTANVYVPSFFHYLNDPTATLCPGDSTATLVTLPTHVEKSLLTDEGKRQKITRVDNLQLSDIPRNGARHVKGSETSTTMSSRRQMPVKIDPTRRVNVQQLGLSLKKTWD